VRWLAVQLAGSRGNSTQSHILGDTRRHSRASSRHVHAAGIGGSSRLGASSGLHLLSPASARISGCCLCAACALALVCGHVRVLCSCCSLSCILSLL
jgi:hypothetical protein